MGKVAVVTGGSRGIGAAIVKKLAKEGYKVVLNYNKSSEEAMAIANSFENVETYQADMGKENEAESIIDYAYNEYGKIDLLVNNAGIDLEKLIQDTEMQEFNNIMNVNMKAVFITSKAAAKYMINQKSGSIINISSIYGVNGASGASAYSMSKGAIDALTKSLAKELGPSNIRVNSIAPGFIDTEMNSYLTVEEVQEVIEEIPLRRLGTPEEVANLVYMVDNAEYVTGEVIGINGGWN